MSERIPRRVLLIATALAAISAFAFSAASASASEVVYSNVPGTLPGNFASEGFSCCQVKEFGGQVELAGTKRNKPVVEVVMSAWACQYGNWSANSCETPLPRKKFRWPLTLSAYEVGANNAVGEKLGSETKTFAMPYRPSDEPIHCPEGEGRWYDAAEATCYHGYAFTVKFPPLNVLRVPKHVIFGISYNTSTAGPSPVGSQACNLKSAGCYYDSLNVGVAEPSEHLLTIGGDPTEPYIESTYAPATCGNTALETEFGPAGACWEGDQPLFKITAH